MVIFRGKAGFRWKHQDSILIAKACVRSAIPSAASHSNQ